MTHSFMQGSDTFTAWPAQQPQRELPDYADDAKLKQAFAIELAKGASPFDAALIVAENHTNKALWISVNWVKDISVIAQRDAYIEANKKVEKPLDRDGLLAKIMAIVDARDEYHRPLVEAKDRITALKLYSDILGFTGKVENNNTVNNSFANKTVNLVMVRPDDRSTTIDQSPNTKSEIINEKPLLTNIKLVKAS